jgi:glutamine amidotransferase
MIIILNYGMGNPGSMHNMFRRIGTRAEVTLDIDKLMSASAIVLPGVGSFDNGIQKLQAAGIMEHLEKRVLHDKIPFLGVCLGMQMLFERSEEGSLPGLGWISGPVLRFNFSSITKTSLKIPHMGWNLVRPTNHETLFRGLEQEPRFYFVHSYHGVCLDKANVLGTSDYGYSFVSAVQKENIFGVQFHPEKSHRFGMTLLKNFAEIASC